MRTTVNRSVALDAMANDSTPTMGTTWCEHVNGALEGIEDVFSMPHRDRKRFVVIVAANFTDTHYATSR